MVKTQFNKIQMYTFMFHSVCQSVYAMLELRHKDIDLYV